MDSPLPPDGRRLSFQSSPFHPEFCAALVASVTDPRDLVRAQMIIAAYNRGAEFGYKPFFGQRVGRWGKHGPLDFQSHSGSDWPDTTR